MDLINKTILFFVLAHVSLCAQRQDGRKGPDDKVYAFFEYKLKQGVGMQDAFEMGYERDLEWHRSQEDDWSWIGWYVINGPRRGQFIDATPDHAWSDFDEWKVNGALNGKLNKIHWTPYVLDPEASYKEIIQPYGRTKEKWFKAKYLQVYHLEISLAMERDFYEFMCSYNTYLESRFEDVNFVWMKTPSGGSMQEYSLFIPMDTIGLMEKVGKIFDAQQLPDKVWELYARTVTSNISEMWRYMPNMSLFPQKNQ